MKNPIKIVWRKATNFARLRRLAREAEAFLVSFPKSGRTWFRFILSNYFNEAYALGASVSLHSTFKILPNFALDDSRGIGAFAYRGRRPSVPLILVSHFNYNRLLFGDRPVILMARDPRDVMVSSYFHATQHKHRFQGDINAFLEDKEQGVPHYCRHMNGWAEALAGRKHKILGYEKLQSDPVGETASILRFIGDDADLSIVKRAVDASRFDAMRKLELEEGLPDHEYDRGDPESLRMRRGKAGGYVDYLNANQIASLNRALSSGLSAPARKILSDIGSTFN